MGTESGMLWEQKIEYAALTDIGFRRRNNQDSYAVQISGDREQWERRGHLFLVADGMGGHAVGELASKIAADTIPHTYLKLADDDPAVALKAAVVAGNATINARGEMNRDFTRMGTTCTTLVLYPQGAVVAHVGDSRAYRIRSDRIEQLTFDHSLQWELLRLGKMSPEEIFSREPPPSEACRLLVDLANLRGGPDNISVVIVRVGAIPPELPQETDPDAVDGPEGRYGWSWLVAVFLAGITLIVGHATRYFGRPLPEGTVIEALGVLGLGALILAWLRSPRLDHVRSAFPAGT